MADFAHYTRLMLLPMMAITGLVALAGAAWNAGERGWAVAAAVLAGALVQPTERLLARARRRRNWKE